MDKQIIQKAEKITQGFFDKMTFEVEIKLEDRQPDGLFLNIQAKEPQILIGGRGRTLSEIQRLLGMMIRKTVDSGLRIDLDINYYKSNKIKYLTGLAQDIADEVAISKREKILFPMSASERRIVHLELSGRRDVKTESAGEEPERRVVVKPA